eukprot:4034827-Pyramimonas_sp.AAC.1
MLKPGARGGPRPWVLSRSLCSLPSCCLPSSRLLRGRDGSCQVSSRFTLNAAAAATDTAQTRPAPGVRDMLAREMLTVIS